VWRDEKLVAVCAYNNYKTFDIELSLASESPRWASKQVITWLLSYPFVQLKTQRVTALVKKSNRRARKLLLGVGFKEEGCHRHAAANLETVFSYGLLKTEFTEKYLSGIKEPARAAAAR
jgi:RimJ/RimL family protein N-acetyltransferase